MGVFSRLVGLRQTGNTLSVTWSGMLVTWSCCGWSSDRVSLCWQWGFCLCQVRLLSRRGVRWKQLCNLDLDNLPLKITRVKAMWLRLVTKKSLFDSSHSTRMSSFQFTQRWNSQRLWIMSELNRYEIKSEWEASSIRHWRNTEGCFISWLSDFNRPETSQRNVTDFSAAVNNRFIIFIIRAFQQTKSLISALGLLGHNWRKAERGGLANCMLLFKLIAVLATASTMPNYELVLRVLRLQYATVVSEAQAANSIANFPRLWNWKLIRVCGAAWTLSCSIATLRDPFMFWRQSPRSGTRPGSVWDWG